MHISPAEERRAGENRTYTLRDFGLEEGKRLPVKPVKPVKPVNAAQREINPLTPTRFPGQIGAQQATADIIRPGASRINLYCALL